MLRGLFELLLIILAVIVSRTLLTNFLKGLSGALKASQDSSEKRPSGEATEPASGTRNSPANELHKDPVCGTYVAGSTPYQRQLTGQTFYYCSTECREKHALVTR